MSQRHFGGPCSFGGKRGGRVQDPTFRAMLDAVGEDDPDYMPEKRVPADPDTLIYIALDREAGQVKIGCSANVPQRIRNLSSQRGRKLELLATTKGGWDLERLLHNRFRPFRAEGREWYRSEIVGELPEAIGG